MTDEPAIHPDEKEDELEAKLSEIENKAKKFRAKSRFPDPPEWNFTRKKTKDDSDSANHLGLGIGLSAAYALVGCMFGGFGVGYLIDRATGGDIAQPIGATVGVILGVVSTFILINRPNS